MIPFKNPYKENPDTADGGTDWLRVSLDVSKRDVNRIRAVTLDWSAVSISLAMFLKYLATYADKHNLDLAHAHEFIEHIRRKCDTDFDSIYSGSAAVVRTVGSSSGQPHGSGHSNDVHGGTGQSDTSVPVEADIERPRKRKPSAKKANGPAEGGFTNREG